MLELTVTGCAERRRRMLDAMAAKRLDWVAMSDVSDIYYFTGVLLPTDFPAAWLMDASGDMVFVGPEGFDLGQVGAQYAYQWNERGTRTPQLAFEIGRLLRQVVLGKRGNAWGIQGDSIAWAIQGLLESMGNGSLGVQPVPIDETLRAMQQRKDADEIALIRAAIAANQGAYAAVQAAIRPGASELEVLAAGYRGAMLAAGEKVFHDGDYQCGAYNGPARARPIEEGELYIVDAWTRRRGYWADMSRTFFVGREPTDVQQALFDHIRWIQTETPALLRPGVDGRQVYASLDAMVREHPELSDQGLIHHGGHAIGLRPHEMPDVNPQRGGKLEPGQVICIEPGGYFAAARAGVRLENMYLITATGCEDLCPGEVVLHVCG